MHLQWVLKKFSLRGDTTHGDAQTDPDTTWATALTQTDPDTAWATALPSKRREPRVSGGDLNRREQALSRPSCIVQ